MTTRLSINLNKIALLRNQRNINLPSMEDVAHCVLQAGAQGITLHPRPDKRHTRPEDVHLMSAIVKDYHVQLNIEGNPLPDFIKLVSQVRPHQITLVPDEPGAVTSDHGWVIAEHRAFLKTIIPQLKEYTQKVILFMDYDSTMEEVADIGADGIELYTEPYATAYRHSASVDNILELYCKAAQDAQQVGLIVHAGHDLSIDNLGDFLQHVPNIDEVSIGHAFTAEALWYGLEATTQKYCNIITTTCQK